MISHCGCAGLCRRPSALQRKPRRSGAKVEETHKATIKRSKPTLGSIARCKKAERAPEGRPLVMAICGNLTGPASGSCSGSRARLGHISAVRRTTSAARSDPGDGGDRSSSDSASRSCTGSSRHRSWLRGVRCFSILGQSERELPLGLAGLVLRSGDATAGVDCTGAPTEKPATVQHALRYAPPHRPRAPLARRQARAKPLEEARQHPPLIFS